MKENEVKRKKTKIKKKEGKNSQPAKRVRSDSETCNENDSSNLGRKV
jgi:hypothetical protein